MVSAIIADDEKKVIELVKMLGNWKEYDIEIIDICSDGEQTLESIKKNKPDIVITDIRMPILDGIEIIAKTKELGINPFFIIISGYKHFEYAHNALKFGVADYILKPIDQGQLNNCLRKICNQIMELRRNQQDKELVSQILSDNLANLKEKFVSEIVFQSSDVNTTVEEVNKKYKLNFSNGYFQALFINTNMIELHRNVTFFRDKISWIANKLFNKCYEIVIGANNTGVICILNYPDEEKESIKKLITSFYHEIKTITEISGSFSLVIGVGSVVSIIQDLHFSIESAIASERAKIILGYNKVIDCAGITFSDLDVDKIVPNQSIKKLSSSISVFNVNDINEWFALLYKNLTEYPNADPDKIYSIRDTILKSLEYSAINIDSADKGEIEKVTTDIIFRTDRANSISNLIYIIRDEIVLFVNIKLNEISEKGTKPILFAKQYIEKNYKKPLTLEEVAEKANLNVTYFSTVFKKTVGEGFIEYLTRIRINASKELLCLSNNTITEIAELIGYPDDKYFRKLFKKEVGIKPSEYRRLYSKV